MCVCILWLDAPTTPEERKKLNRINDFWKPFYYRWVETFLDKGSGEDVVPLDHFLHRFSRSIFWELEDMIPLYEPPPLIFIYFFLIFFCPLGACAMDAAAQEHTLTLTKKMKHSYRNSLETLSRVFCNSSLPLCRVS